MKKPTKTKAKALQACQSLEEAQSLIAQIGDSQREITRLTTEMNDEIAQITEKYAGQLNPHKLSIDELTAKVQIFCEANRDRLLEKGGKTANLITGEVAWRISPPSVSVRGTDETIERLEKAGLDRFIRVKKSINKEAILDEPTAVQDIKGISISSGVEHFSITPFEVAVN